jgi:hypothetical protein
VRLKKFDLEALARDRDQLWAEAATREAAGESIRLNEDLWPLAAEEQAQRTAADSYLEQIQHHIGHVQHGKISVEDLCCILDVRGAQRTQDHNIRLNKAMTELGWRRPNKKRLVRIKGRLVSGFVIGESPWDTTVEAYRDRDGLYVIPPVRDEGAASPEGNGASAASPEGESNVVNMHRTTPRPTSF